MKECGVFHPDDINVVCRLPPGMHDPHMGGYEPDLVIWDNPNYIPQSSGNTPDLFKKIVQQVRSDEGDEYPYADL